uniref:Uncharacterized protein n=1 Tax=Rhizophora mucronata TaxID=61149 RepID=A0A2P2PXL8_RHIMU
MKKKTQKKI